MENSRNGYTEREKTIIEIGKDIPEVQKLARQLSMNMRASHPAVKFSIGDAIVLLGEIGIFLYKQNELEVQNENL